MGEDAGTGKAQPAHPDGKAEAGGGQIGRWIGAGVGSAALAAALLYATRGKRKPDRR